MIYHICLASYAILLLFISSNWNPANQTWTFGVDILNAVVWAWFSTKVQRLWESLWYPLFWGFPPLIPTDPTLGWKHYGRDKSPYAGNNAGKFLLSRWESVQWCWTEFMEVSQRQEWLDLSPCRGFWWLRMMQKVETTKKMFCTMTKEKRRGKKQQLLPVNQPRAEAGRHTGTMGVHNWS